MEPITFDKLLITTAFCCMASDGNIDKREIKLVKSMCEISPLIKDINFQDEINQLVININSKGKVFIQEYFNQLKNTDLSNQEELTLIDFAIQTINADEHVEYAEIKFFKNIRHRLKVSDEAILAVLPDIEQFLEADIVTESFLDKITTQYLKAVDLPKFELISIDNNSLDDSKESQP